MILKLEDGAAHLKTIVEKAGLQGIDITNNHTNYGDKTTLHVVGIACEVNNAEFQAAYIMVSRLVFPRF